MCVSQCPPKYYPTVNATSGSKQCLVCQPGCSICSEYNICQAWDGQEAYIPNLWKDKMEFWLLLIIILCSLIGYIIFKIVKKHTSSDLEENMMTKSDDKDSGEKDKNNEEHIHEVKIGVDHATLQNDSMADSLGPTMDMKGDTLWFNELVEM